MDRWLRDLRFAFRALRRQPGLVAVATVSLSLGIAVYVVIFAAVDLLVFRPLPYPQPDRLVQVWSSNPARGWDATSVSLADFADWRREARTIDLAAYGSADFNLAPDGEAPERVEGLMATAAFFRILGTSPGLGRSFDAGQETAGRDRAVLLTDHLWQQRFGGDSAVVGTSIRLDGMLYEIVGVLPPSFRFGYGIDLFVPLAQRSDEPRGNRSYEVIGRLRPGQTMDAAEAELDRIAARLAAIHPASNDGMETRLVSLQRELVGDEAHRGSVISLVAVVCVLLIACANVANLLLARGVVRSRELAVRTALGASRGALLRQLLVEGILLSLAGGVLGLLLARVGIRWLASLFPPDFPRLDELVIDPRALAVGVIVTVLCGIGSSLVPALTASRAAGVSPLQEGARGSVSRRAGRLRANFVIGELALALVLLISAGLLLKAALVIQQRPLGFDPAQVLTFRISLPAEEYPDDAAVRGATDGILERLTSHPGVRAAAITSRLPLTGSSGTYYRVDGEPDAPDAHRPVLQFRMATPGYAAAIGLRVTRGRWLDPADGPTAPGAIVVNETLARRHWPDASPLGRRLVFSSGTYEVVGVVADAAEFGRDDPAPPIAFFSASQRPVRRPVFTLRGAGPAGDLGPIARAAVAEVTPTVPPYDVTPLAEIVRVEEQDVLIMPKLLSVFGVLALFLSLMGVYGVMAYLVSQRTAELGIRRALGAESRDIVLLVVRHGARLALAGSAIGLVLALAGARSLAVFLYGVSPFDPAVFGLVTAALVLAALAATLAPARRALAVAPTEALRSD